MCVCVTYLELVLLDDPPGLQVLVDHMKHGQHGDVGLAGAGGSADQEVLVGVVGRLKHQRLDPVQTLHALKHQLCDLTHRGRNG